MVFEYKILELNDQVLSLVLMIQKLMAAKKGRERGSDVNGQMPLRNSKINLLSMLPNLL